MCGLHNNAVYSVWVTQQYCVKCVGYTAMWCTGCGLHTAVYSVRVIQQCYVQCTGYTPMLCTVYGLHTMLCTVCVLYKTVVYSVWVINTAVYSMCVI